MKSASATVETGYERWNKSLAAQMIRTDLGSQGALVYLPENSPEPLSAHLIAAYITARVE